MSSSDHDPEARKPATHDPDFVEFPHRDAIILGDARLDNLMTAVTALGMEVWTMRRRMLVTEAVLSRHGIDPEEIELYSPTAEENADWTDRRDQFLKAVYGCLLRDADAPHLTDLVDSAFEDPAARASAKASV